MRVKFTLNGAASSFDVDDNVLLLDLIRDSGLTGAKPSCEMQVCGACTVLVDGLPFSSCTTLAADVDGRRVETIEGLSTGDLHPVQRAFLERFGFQCGFCTPGMVLAAKSLLEHEPHPTRDQIVHWMDGNICRCTGYQSILEAIQLAAEQPR